VFKNATRPPSKRSRIEKKVDYIILFTFSLLLTWCILGSVYFSWWTHVRMPHAWCVPRDWL
jgi:hypothetical protein